MSWYLRGRTGSFVYGMRERKGLDLRHLEVQVVVITSLFAWVREIERCTLVDCYYSCQSLTSINDD